MSAIENECSGALLGDDDAIDEMSILLEEMERSEAGGGLKDDPIEDPKMESIINMWNSIACDPLIQSVFKYKLSWTWPPDAKYMFLVSLPTFDKNSLLLDIDPRFAITKYLNKIFEPGTFGIIPCTFGHNGNTFQSHPSFLEFNASCKYLKEFISIVKPECIFTIDAFPAEAMRCDMDANTIYMTRYDTTDIKAIPQLMRSVDMGALMRTTLGGTGSYRYIMLPKFSATGKAFKASIMKHREDLDHLIKFTYKAIPISIFDPELNFPRDNMDQYITLENMVESMLTDTRYDALKLRPNMRLITPEEERSEYMFLTSVQFDHEANVMRCFFSTPHGNPHLLQVAKPPMVFGFVPHAAFSMNPLEPIGGNFANMAENLTEDDLKPLHAALCDKLRWVFEYKRWSILQDIKLSIVMARLHGESFYYRQRKVIICNITDYKLMKPIIQMLERLIKQWPVKNDQMFKPLETFSPEQVFSYSNTFKTCHWYRIKNYKTIAHKRSTQDHVRQIESLVTYDPKDPPFECIVPDTNVPVGNGKTSSGLPPHVQVSMDIECVGDKNHFPDPWKNPINTICNTAWRKENEGIETNSKTHTPLKGYLYVTFNLGLGNPSVTHTNLLSNGQSIHYYFTNEKDLILAYCWWLHFMIPDYYMGHNFKAFDINYIVQRAIVLGLTLPPLGRVNSEVIRVDRHKMSTRAFGDRMITGIKGMTGVCLLDFLEILLRDFKLESNTLDFAGMSMLGDTKLVMPYNALRGNWLKSPETFQKVIDYCVVDAQLVDRLVTAKMCVSNAMSLSIVNGTVTPAELWVQGMQIKVFSTIAHINSLRPPELRVMFPTIDNWSYQHNDIIVERHMVKNGCFDEETPEVDPEPSENLVVWSGTSSSVASTSSSSSSSNRKRGDRPEGDEYAQGMFHFSGGFISRPNEINPKRARPTCSSSVQNEEKEDYDKILKEIKLNGGREEVVKSRVIADTYVGAVVIDAPLGMYFEFPNLCMDFEGLYPSIIMAYNMGGDTLIYESDRIEFGLSLDQVHTPPDCTARNPRTGKVEIYHFVKKEIWPSVISESEAYLKTARGKAKRLMAEAGAAGDVNLKNFYNALQNNFKLIMNSIYGALGVTKGPIACKAVAQAVTAWGRYWIMEMKRVVAEVVGGETVGGDTDSIFVRCLGMFVNGKLRHRIRNREEGEIFGPWLVKNVLNVLLPAPMALAYEKMMWYLLTIAKKRYNYIHIELFQDPRINAKGMETVRRDATKYTKATLKYMQNALLVMPTKEVQSLLYPKPCKANPFTYYTCYEHHIYTMDGLKYQPLEGYVTMPVSPEHANALEQWNAMSPLQRETHLQVLKQKWRDDEKKYYEIQTKTIKENKQKLVDYVKQRAKDLINGKVPLTQCIQSKQRSKENYKSDKQPHLTVIKLKEMRGEEVPQIGERVRFAFRSLPKSPNGKGKLKARKAYECAEDPVVIIRENQPVDWIYYLHNTFVKPVTRYMRWVLKDEMTEKIRNRRKAAKKRSTSFFVPTTQDLFEETLPTSAKDTTTEESHIIEEDISLADITEEVTQYLFETPNKKSPLYADIDTRYNKLIHTRKRALPHNNPLFSPIAQYRKTKNEEARNLFERHNLRSDTNKTASCSFANHTLKDIEDLAVNIDALSIEYKETYDKCMKTCTTCLGTDTVECENTDCDEFLPRINAEVKFERIKKDKVIIHSLKNR